MARTLGMGDLTFFSRIHYGGWCGVRHGAPGRHGRRQRRGRRRRLLPGVQRALGPPFRDRRAGPCPDRQRRERPLLVVRAPRPAHPGVVGGHVRPALPARHRGHHRGLRTGGGGGPGLRRHQPRGVVLRQAHHLGRPPGVAVDRRTAAPARLLPGVRRGPGHRGHEPRSCPRLRPTAGGHRSRGAGLGRPAGHDDVVLPRRHDPSPRDGRGGSPAVGDLGPRPRRHAVRGALRPLHAVRALPARGARASANGARPRSSCATATSGRAASSPPTPTAASWARPTSTG